ncbi:hypothetical protein [Psychromicrobium lacuslunae]|uniref:Uncharacterized protein n=1 Tax=Psychromicrobium lacuslunae TaxID=1618207 RepID=A0A0D4BXH4_9MICC|nr:hypothetical protein [Psychromicrobium lacuslunae]AJT40826.1 hypothetical protein UM93_03615 [Psychromicrobium lacuslunae]
MADPDRNNEIGQKYQKPIDQMPATSQNMMAGIYRDELHSKPAKRTWPFLIFPAIIVLVVIGIYLFNK